jgi:hypothetical protein
VDYIAPDPEKREDVKRQSDEVRDCIESKLSEDGYILEKSLYSGSFANKTGLRRNMRGNDEVEGQDIDIAFILEETDQDGNEVQCLVSTFEGYLDEKWSSSDTGKTKSSATISFASSKQSFDTVPLLKTSRKNIERLLRTNGEERQSSIEKHNEFTRSRTDSSNAIKGVVRFNDCVRLVKWWRYQMQTNSTVFGNGENDQKVPSFLLILLCAHAYDVLSVKKTYPETLAIWFSYLAHATRNKCTIIFDDYIKNHATEESDWLVLDPMDDTNNIVQNWNNTRMDELAEWFELARDKMVQSIRHDEEGDDQKSLNCLIQLFGNSINNQCKNV